MDFNRALSIALSVILYGVVRRYLDRYKAWKAARVEIPYYPNWRGHFVPDLKIKRIERALVSSLVLLFFAALAWSVWALW